MAIKGLQQKKPVDLHEPVQAKHLEVTAASCRNDVDRMIRKFTKKVRADGIMRDAVFKSRFTKPSALRRMKSRASLEKKENL